MSIYLVHLSSIDAGAELLPAPPAIESFSGTVDGPEGSVEEFEKSSRKRLRVSYASSGSGFGACLSLFGEGATWERRVYFMIRSSVQPSRRIERYVDRLN